MKSRSAHAVMFGFDFQVNAAIVLMLENIKELQSLRLEGNDEDIELTLNNKQKIYAQAKSIENSSYDFTNVRKNLKKALESLSNAAMKNDAKQLILITNSPNPLKDDESRSIFWGPAHREYSDLPPSAQKIVDNYLKTIPNPLEPKLFMVQVLPFETDNENERYKVVWQVINDFISSLNTTITPGLGKQLREIWHKDIFINGTKKDYSIILSKKEIIWPILVIETDIKRCENTFLDELDIGMYDEVVRVYKDTIDYCCERIDFFTKVLFDFNKFQSTKCQKEKVLEFINNSWRYYINEFMVEGIDNDTLEALTKIILYNILRRRIVIDKVKQEVNL